MGTESELYKPLSTDDASESLTSGPDNDQGYQNPRRAGLRGIYLSLSCVANVVLVGVLVTLILRLPPIETYSQATDDWQGYNCTGRLFARVHANMP